MARIYGANASWSGAKYMARDLAKAYGVRQEVIMKAIRKANHNFGIEMRREAKEMSSGPYSLYVLRKMGHPYARRHGKSLLPADVINVQSGSFRKSWRIRTSTSTKESKLELYNDSPHAIYIRFAGTGGSKMVARPILTTVFNASIPGYRYALRQAAIQAHTAA